MSLVHLTSFHDPCRPPSPLPAPPGPHGVVCHIGPGYGIATCPTERGNGIVQSFTSPALRLTESIKRARPPSTSPPIPSPPPFPYSLFCHLPPSSNPSPHLSPSFHFCQFSIRPNYYCLGCQRRFLARLDHAEIRSMEEHTWVSTEALNITLSFSVKCTNFSFTLNKM